MRLSPLGPKMLPHGSRRLVIQPVRVTSPEDFRSIEWRTRMLGSNLLRPFGRPNMRGVAGAGPRGRWPVAIGLLLRPIVLRALSADMRFHAGEHRWSLRVLSVFAALCGFTAGYAGTITVTNNAGSGPGSLRQAIADAQENDTITFAGKVRGTIALAGTDGELVISKALTIVGPGANLLSIDAGNASRVLRVDQPGRVVSISGLEFTRGEDQLGGGILNRADLTLTACIVSACRADSLGAYGGGICNAVFDGPEQPGLHMVGCTMTGNSSQGDAGFHGGAGGEAAGGALYNYRGKVLLENCTISGNTATGGAPGCVPLFGCGSQGKGYGGIYSTEGELLVESCTISNNSGNTVGGIAAFGGGRMANTIVARNTRDSSETTQPDVRGSFISDGFNLIGQSDGNGFDKIGDQTGTDAAPLDPMLGPLRDNGGPTETMGLLSGSPAIDQGLNKSAAKTDQRGMPRTHEQAALTNAAGGDGTDIGAFELESHESIFANIATRLKVGEGDNAMIGGFIITGTHTKTLAVRGLGPSLMAFGVPNALKDPLIEVHGGSGQLLATNDNWNDALTRQEIIDSGLGPTNDLESALWGIIDPGNYTVVVRGKNGETGVGLFEVYDLDSTVDAKLANISTRGFVDTGDNAMIGGTIITGSTVANVLFRGIGPSLTSFGVSNPLQDPTIELHDGQGALMEANDNWQDSPNKQAIMDTSIPPRDDRESAILRSLPPGAYTVILRGSGDSTGVGVVEAYRLQ